MIPLTERFNPEENDIRYSAKQKNGSSDVGTKENPIELSENTELNNLVAGISGAQRYKMIRDYIMSVLDGKEVYPIYFNVGEHKFNAGEYHLYDITQKIPLVPIPQ